MIIRYAGLAFAIAAALGFLHLSNGAALAGPTCSDSGLDIEVHGDHVIRDYVIGADGTGPAHEGAEVPGGPGPGFHFVAPAPTGFPYWPSPMTLPPGFGAGDCGAPSYWYGH